MTKDMKRLFKASCITTHSLRCLTIDVSRDPIAALSGLESDATVLAVAREGKYVTSTTHLSVIHQVFQRLSRMVDAQHRADNFNDFIIQQRSKGEILRRVVIRRDFWSLEDFNNPEMNESFGVQNYFFDNYAWSNDLWKKFQSYVEKWFPFAEHTHLAYFEYIQLIRYFYFHRDGFGAPRLLPGARLHPPFGVPVLSKPMREPVQLYSTWLKSFAPALGMKKALVIRAGCGLLSCVTRLAVPLVKSTDTSPLAIEGLRKDFLQLGHRFRHMTAEVAEMFPSLEASMVGNQSVESRDEPKRQKTKYDLIVFSPDVPFLNINEGWYDNRFAPTQKGVQGDLERFFEEAGDHLTDHGVLVVVTTNVFSLAFPTIAHPIELEIKANRRWLLLDYFDQPMNGAFAQDVFSQDSLTSPTSNNVIYRAKGLRAEVWVLHKMESLRTFGWLHGLPGCAPPSNVVGQWRGFSLQSGRLRAIKQRLSEMGGDWGSYRDRLMNMLKDQSNVPEDEVAQAVRMAIDPSYAEELAEKSKVVVLTKLNREKEFHHRVWEKYQDLGKSPRETFDATVEMMNGVNHTNKSGGEEGAAAGNPKSKRRTKKKKQRSESKVSALDAVSL